MEEELKPIYYFVGNGINGNEGGGMKLPIGFRFQPTDEELVVHYLKRKVYCFPLPASVIPEFDVFQTNPWDLPGDVREKRYFFCKRQRNVNKSCNRLITSTTTNATSSGRGYWKAVGKEKQIVVVDHHHHPAATGNPRGSSNQAVAVVGVKKSLVFCQLAAGKHPHASIRRVSRTQWVMHEFRLILGSQSSPNSNSTLLQQQQQQQQKFKMEMEDWVVCRIYQKKRKLSKNIGAARIIDHHLSVGKIRPSIMDIMMMREVSNEYSGPPQPSSSSSSSCSSGITEVSSKGSDQEETTSPYY